MADAVPRGPHVLNDAGTRCRFCGIPLPEEGFSEEQCRSHLLPAAVAAPAPAAVSPATPPRHSAPSVSPSSPPKFGTINSGSTLVAFSHAEIHEKVLAAFQQMSGAEVSSLREGDGKVASGVLDKVRLLFHLVSTQLGAPKRLHWSHERLQLAVDLIRLARRDTVPHRLVAGIRGIGKTTFVRHLVYLLPLFFPDTIIFFKDYYVKHVPPSALLAEYLAHTGLITRDAVADFNDIMVTVAEFKRLTKLNIVFFFDEVQHLFSLPPSSYTHTALSVTASPSQAELADSAVALRQRRLIVDELRSLIGSATAHAAVYLFGSAFHLVSTTYSPAHGAGAFQIDKLPIRKVLPLRTQEEFKAAWTEVADPSWRTADSGQSDVALLREAYMLTGGIYRELAQTKQTVIGSQRALPGGYKAEYTALSVLYEMNRKELKDAAFDPFHQVCVSKAAMLAAMEPLGDVDERAPGPVRFGEHDLSALADLGLLHLDDNLASTFLLPQHYVLMQQLSHGLTFAERMAIHYPQGRTLAEMWERFYAEECQRASPGLKLPAGGAEVWDYTADVPANWQWVWDHRDTIYKLHPDDVGFDLVYWTMPAIPSASAAGGAGSKRKKTGYDVQLFLIQVKVGKKTLYVSPKEVAHVLAQYNQGPNYLKFFNGFHSGLTNHAPDHLAINVQLLPRLVTSRRLSTELAKKFAELKIQVFQQQFSYTQWGQRVQAYCEKEKVPLFD